MKTVHYPSNLFEAPSDSSQNAIFLKGVKTHNLNNIDVSIPKSQFTVVTGVSGSGKSSLAFDTLFAEGQRRYTESLSTYVRQFLEQMSKPPLDAIENIQPALALRQKNDINNARSTVGTVTEINELLQVVFARAGDTYCPNGHGVVRRDTVMGCVDELIAEASGERVYLVATVRSPDEEEQHRGTLLRQLVQDGYRRLYVDDNILEIDDEATREKLLGLDQFPVMIDRFKIDAEEKQRIAEAVEHGFALGRGSIRVILCDRPDKKEFQFSQSYICNVCGETFVEPRPELFNFNNSLGACKGCDGRGRAAGIDYKLVIPNRSLSILDGAVKPFQTPSQRTWQQKLINAMKEEGYAIDIPFRILPQDGQRFVISGKRGSTWSGIRGYFNYHRNKGGRFSRILLAKYRGYDNCEECEGSRLSEAALNVYFHGKRLPDFWDDTIQHVGTWFDELKLSELEEEGIGIAIEEIRHRLRYLNQIGIGYLTLGRPSPTLSGGETQRVHLTTSLGRALTDTLYVLDEPTAGLHARDSQRLLEILRHLRELGNTVVVVEHDPEIIEGADHVIEIGPAAGHLGGNLIFNGPIDTFLKGETLSARSLRDRFSIPRHPKTVTNFIEIKGARANNLNNIDVKIPIGQMTVVTGVSGSGKSSLVTETLYRHYLHDAGNAVEAGEVDAITGFEHFGEIELMDQSAIGRSTRSNAMTYTGTFDYIRKEFAKSHDAKKHGISARDFSVNVNGGRCEECSGLGFRTVDMHFLADIEVECEECRGKRYQPRILDIYLRGKNIDDIYRMTVEEGIEFFIDQRKIVDRLRPLREVGLSYLQLGQMTTTLSGGEAQRLKLATYMQLDKQIAQNALQPVLFIFDEPTVGLHTEDVKVLVIAMRKLISQGHTVVVVEHNIDFIAQCDYVIDIGPEAGIYGGNVVATGTPEEVSCVSASYTGRYLKEYFDKLN